MMPNVETVNALAERLPAGAVSTHHGELATHAHDRSALALLRELRGARVPPATLVFPTATEHVAIALGWAEETATAVVVRGSGHGVSGGAQALKRCVLIDLSRMNRVLRVDDVSQTAQVQAGARVSELETALAARNLTAGFDAGVSGGTVGGWLSSGLAGAGPAGFVPSDRAVVGLTVVLAGGEVARIGPNERPGDSRLAPLFVGSAGRLGIVTEATVAASRLPATWGWEAFGPHSFDSGAALVREVLQGRYRPLVVTLLDGEESAAVFGPSSGLPDGPVVLAGFDAGAAGSDPERFELRRVARGMGAHSLGAGPAEHWWAHRDEARRWYDAVMGAERALGPGVIADTFEVAASWTRVPHVYHEARGVLLDHAESVRCRVVQPQGTGASLVFTFVVRGESDRDVESAYLRAWTDAVRAAAAAGGASELRLQEELIDPDPPAGWPASRRVKEGLDPAGILHPTTGGSQPDAISITGPPAGEGS
jgi:alkyldihydroxyacetonephosphate synthase